MVEKVAGYAVEGTDVVLKFNKNVYENKITILEEYAKQLEGHLTKLESLKGRIHEFWKDPSSVEYVGLMTDQIIKIKNRQSEINRKVIMYQKISQQAGSVTNTIGEMVQSAKSALSKLGE